MEIELLPGLQAIAEPRGRRRHVRRERRQEGAALRPHAGGLLFADDSGLEVDALGGAPGVYSARYSLRAAGPPPPMKANNRLLLEKLRGVENRSARFVCAIALAEGGRVVRRLARRGGGRHPATKRAAPAASATIRCSTARRLAARSARRRGSRSYR